jgi:tight adherence protein B
MDDALTEMAERTGSENVSFALTAVTIHRQVGGGLAGGVAMGGETPREGPLALTVMNPGYMRPLYTTSAGHMLMLIGLAMMVVGSLIIHKIVSFKG